MLLAATPLYAQWQATLDGGYAHLKQVGIAESNALTIGANLDHLGDHATVQSAALASRTTVDRWTLQGILGGSLVSPAARGARLELVGSLSTFAASNDLPTVSTELMGRARAGRTAFGGAIGIGGGSFSREARTAPLVHVQANAWRVLERDQFVGEASFVHTRSTFLTGSVSAFATLLPLSYADCSASWRREYGAVSFGAIAGVRAGIDNVERRDGWASADALAWLTPRVALVAGAGRTLEDIVRGAPSTRYISLSMRIAAQPHPSLSTRRPAAAGPKLVVERMPDGRRRIEVRVQNVSRVELRSDFTNWNPLALERDGDVWRTERLVSSGLHRITIRIDGGEWIVPANLPHATDDLGGVVGLINVP